MKVGLAVAFLGCVAACFQLHSNDSITVVIGGDAEGSLSPCGCTKPMSGGMVRKATVIRRAGQDAVWLENGGYVVGTTSQEQMKAQAMAEMLSLFPNAAGNLDSSVTRLGKGMAYSMSQLSEGRMVSAVTVATPVQGDLPSWRKVGPFLVTGYSSRAASVAAGLDVQTSGSGLDSFVNQAQADGLPPVVMFEGSLGQARGLAQAYPQLAMVVYSSTGSSPLEPVREGQTLLLTAGSGQRDIITVQFSGGQFSGYRRVELGPEYADDPAAREIYRRYLGRVDKANFLGQLVPQKSDPFAGSKACMTCHRESYKVWQTSAHAHAFITLKAEGHGKDPDCVKCHVTGLGLKTGFISEIKTAAFANVSCESCHGPSQRHALAPRRFKLAKVTQTTCLKCHTPEQSPGFDFVKMWAKINHR